MNKKIITVFLTLVLSFSLFATDYYVLKNGGSNKNRGTSKTKPFKNIAKALNKAKEGDTIYIGKGDYEGLLDKGYIKLDKAINIKGSFDKKFIEQDIFKYPTFIKPTSKSDGTRGLIDALSLNVRSNNKTFVIEGIVFDHGESNAYAKDKGSFKNSITGRLTRVPDKNNHDRQTDNSSLIGGSVENSELTIRNCVFNNASFKAIKIKNTNSTINVVNNVFTNSCVAAVEIWGGGYNLDDTKVNIKYNTILFTWPRTCNMEDMGYAIRIMTGIKEYTIDNNILACSYFAAIDRTHMDAKGKESQKEININNNAFYSNIESDILLPSSGSQYMRLRESDIYDIEGFNDVYENVTLTKDHYFVKNYIDQAYFKGFIQGSKKESSSSGLFGSLFENKDKKKYWPYANYFSPEDSLNLFGASKEYGAQIPNF